MQTQNATQEQKSLLDCYRCLSRGKKIIVVTFVIWAVQAVPKWTLAVVGDGEMASRIMTTFIPPG